MPRLLGSETPRIWTPPLRELTPETSLGFDVVTFAETVLEIRLNPWQRWLLIHALELRAEGGFRFSTIVVLVGRQNGKSTVSQILALFWLYVEGTPVVLGTAQDLDTAEEVWDGAWDLIESIDELRDLALPPILVNGKKTIRLKTGERYKVKAANRRAGRGLSGDRIILDELREHQNWDAWAAITKTTMAREFAQIWCFSNAGDVTSIVLRHLRKRAHATLGDPDGINAADAAGLEDLLPSQDELDDALDRVADDSSDDLWDEFDEVDDLDVADLEAALDSLALFEWSAPPGCDIRDRKAWAWANPSLGYTTPLRNVAAACAGDPEHVFRTEVLCQWIDGALEGPYPAGTWTGTVVDDVSLPGESIDPAGRVVFGLAVSWNRSAAYVTVGGYRPDGLPQFEFPAARYGTDWVAGWFCDPAHPDRARRPIAIQKGSPAWSLAETLREAGLVVEEWSGGDVGTATDQVYDAVRYGQLRHPKSGPVDRAAASAVVKQLGPGASVIDLKASPVDAAPLSSMIAAFWLLGNAPADPAPLPPPPAAVSARSFTDPAAVQIARF